MAIAIPTFTADLMKARQCLNQNDSFVGWCNAITNRMAHYFDKGVWINERYCLDQLKKCHFVVESLDDQRHLQFRFNSLVAQQYPNYRSVKVENIFIRIWRAVERVFIFFVQFIKNPSTVGALCPVSSYLTAAITRMVPKFECDSNAPPRRILDIGPGTGPEADEIVRKLRVCDKLVLVEYDKEFCKVLRERFGHMKNVQIIEGSIFDYSDPVGFDIVISCLPLTGFSATDAKRALAKYKELTKVGGTISFSQFMLFSRMSELFHRIFCGSGSDIVQINKARKRFFTEEKGWQLEGKDWVWPNVTPMYAYHFKKTS